MIRASRLEGAIDDRQNGTMPKAVPYSLEAEKAVLGCFLEQPDLFERHGNQLVDSDFFDPSHRRIFQAICQLADRGEVIRAVSVLPLVEVDDRGAMAESISAAIPDQIAQEIATIKDRAFRRIEIAKHEVEIAILENAGTPFVFGTVKPAVSVCDIACKVQDDPDELLKSRFLCIGGGAMINGPTGIGKSSFIMQAAVLWALGKPFFGIQPARPLKSLIVQAENDNGDLVEQREGVFVGLNLSDEEKTIVRANVFIRSENAKTGTAFINGVLRPMIEGNRPDLLWLDNLFAYCGCNVSDQEKMSLFLRTQINPLIQELRCAIIIAHHTNKPPSGDQKADWSASETAYLGSGSAELANWPRAILSIRALKTQGVFELIAGKRGGRLKWKDADGNGTCRRNIAHSNDGLIYWREASAEQIEARKSGPTKYDVQQLLVVGQVLSKDSVISKANEIMGILKAKGFIAELVSDGIFKVIEKPRPRTNPAIYLERIL